MRPIRIAIDGPAGAGKSTVARKVANQLHMTYIDTGAMYRAVTWKALQEGIPLNDEQQLDRIAANMNIQFEGDDPQQVFVQEENVTLAIRTPEVTKHVSEVSALASVRMHLVELQKQMARYQSVVMDGRDIGTTVIPDAEVKIFLTASVQERATRRHEELLAKGYTTSLDDVASDIISRDHYDSTRKESPLRMSDDAVLLDTTGLAIPDVVAHIIEIYNKKIGTYS